VRLFAPSTDQRFSRREPTMRISMFVLSAATLCAITTATSAATASTRAPVKKQRVVIEGLFNIGSGTGTFKLVPMTAGPLKADSGTFADVQASGGGLPPPVIRNGQSVTVIKGSDAHTGKRGRFTVSERLALVGAGPGLADGSRYGVVTGSWSLTGNSGVYDGVVGGGAYAAVVIPKTGKNVRFSEEGIVTAG
jgi:hypothetical protein